MHTHYNGNPERWKRVSRRQPCPICKKCDWCLFTGPDNSPDAAICARVESENMVGSEGAGWLHRLHDDREWNDRPRRRRIPYHDRPRVPTISLGTMVAECESALGPNRRGLLAYDLGVSAESLSRLHVGWSERHRAFTFPMVDASCNFRGVRLRSIDGHKWSVRGGREGLFVAEMSAGCNAPFDGPGLLLLCEGPTDTAALLDLGFSAIGRPSCTGGNAILLGLLLADDSFTPREVVVVADDDVPGQRGAWRLASMLVSYVPKVRVISPPTGIKDTRQWKREGATRADVLQAIDSAPVLQLTYGVEAVAR